MSNIVKEVQQLSYQQRLQVYEHAKRKIPPDIPPKKYEQIIKRLTKYLEI